MSPKFFIRPHRFYRDSLFGNPHPGELAAHDLFIMFAIMCRLPVELDHFLLPGGTRLMWRTQAVKYGIERLASVSTFAEFYCVASDGTAPLVLLKDILFKYLWLCGGLDVDADGVWLDLLSLSQALEFPELYVYVILQACQQDLEEDALESLTEVLQLSDVDEAATLLRVARQRYLPVYQAHIGNIVHIPLMGLTDYRAVPPDTAGQTLDEVITSNARILAGSIWEAHMRSWAYWRGLQWRERQSDDSQNGLRWRQRFPRYGLLQNWHGVMAALGEGEKDVRM